MDSVKCKGETYEFVEQISPTQALRRIQALKYLFMGNREELHEEIDRIISKVKS